MLEYVNSVACSVMLAYCFVMAVLLPGARYMWANRLVMWAVSTALAAQVVSPWSDLVPSPSWPAALLHVCLAAALLVWRREAMCFLRSRFVIPPPKTPRRRLSDLTEADAARVSGGTKE